MRTNQTTRRLLASLALTTALAAPGVAFAQADAAAAAPNGEIIVTAQRRAESILKVPVAVTAMSQDDLTKRGITNTAQMTGMVPSLQVNSPYGDSQPNFTIRGIGVANEHNPNQASPVGIYFDDAYIAARAVHGLQLFDLERVEVLRGPQGTLYGRNTTGGAINFLSKKPSLSGMGGNFQVGYANYNTFTASGALDATLAEDKAGLRVSFNYGHGDGYIKNIAQGEPDANSTDFFSARAILLLKPTDDLTVTLKGTYGRSNPTQAGVFNLGTGENDRNPVLDTGRNEKGMTFFETDSKRLGHSYVRAEGVELTVKYDLSDTLSLTSLTSYDHAQQEFTQEGTGLTSAVLTQPLDTLYGNRFKMFNQEVRLTYAQGDTNIQAGAYYGYDKDASNSYYWLFDGAAMIHQFYDQIRKSSAVFAQADQKFNSHFGATLGLRYTWDRSSYENYASSIAPSAGYTGDRSTDIFPIDTSFYIHGSYDAASGKVVSGPTIPLRSSALTGRLALNYTFDNGQMLYASYSRGYRSAAYCGQCFSAPINTTKPEKVDAYEVGAKGRFIDNMLTLSVSAFLMKYRNQQINETDGAQTLLANVDKSKIKGIEFEASLAPSGTFRISANGSFLDAKYQKAQLLFGSIAGQRVPYAPRFQASGKIDWELAKYGDGAFNFTPSVVYSSLSYFTPYNKLNGNGRLKQGPNAKVNAQLSYDTDKYTVRLWVNNLFNRKTFADGLDLRGAFGYDYLVAAPPRQFGGSFAYRF
ncbi:TonB-dependent receptor [Novosphingobium sp.]|uniref:TonB-dependent receptor n=1 Tax=Novosphingobium sp. TaxID=1874826 RepID=UPI0038BCC133